MPVEDELRLPVAVKQARGPRVTTRLMRHGPCDPKVLAACPPSEHALDQFADRLHLDATVLRRVAAKPSPPAGGRP